MQLTSQDEDISGFSQLMFSVNGVHYKYGHNRIEIQT